MPDLKDHPLIKQLLAIGLPPEDFVVFGSGPMLARGIKESRDLDVLARGAAWTKASAGGTSEAAGGGRKAVIGDIEIFNDWGPGEWHVDELIDGADVIEGIRFATLENVLKWKRLVGRPKDREHISLIEAYLKGQK
jgi:hypothetical protein